MKNISNSNTNAQKIRIPASIVFIVLPLLCLVLLIFKWNDIWLTIPWMIGASVSFYVLSVAYLVFACIFRMRLIEVIGFFILLATNILPLVGTILMWKHYILIPYYWVLMVLLMPALFMVVRNRVNKNAAQIFAMILSIIVLLIVLVFLLLTGFVPAKYEYTISPNGEYVALEYSFTTLPGGTDVYLCRTNGPLLNTERILYLANYSDFGREIEWLNDSNVFIYKHTMDVFQDEIIKDYNHF